jgi:hypothetical protein
VLFLSPSRRFLLHSFRLTFWVMSAHTVCGVCSQGLLVLYHMACIHATNSLNVAVEWLSLLLCFREVPALTLGPEFGGPCCLHLQGEMSGAWIKIQVEIFCVLVGYHADSIFGVKMEAATSSEKLASSHKTTRHHNPKT